MSKLTRIIRFIRHWHARIGVLAALFFLILSLTGLALNHTGLLRLDKREINSQWLMQWYGLKSSIPASGYLFNDGYLAASDERWVMDGRALAAADASLVGATSWGAMRAIASKHALYLYADGQLVEKIEGAALPAESIEKLGVIESSLVLKTAQGNFGTMDGLEWQPVTSDNIRWLEAQALPSSLQGSLKEAFLPSLPLERIVLDIHSGRFFGQYGPIAMDFAAIVLTLLSLSGFWIYLRSARKKPKQ